MENEEIEELETTERGVSLPRFREYSSDILLKTYFLMERYYGDQGAEIIL